jgi:hypothetical protein
MPEQTTHELIKNETNSIITSNSSAAIPATAAAGSTTTTVTLHVAPGFLFYASRFNFLVLESFISNPAQ